MPSLTSSSSNVSIELYLTALSIPQFVMDALLAVPEISNVILPQILKSREYESLGFTLPVDRTQAWVVCIHRTPMQSRVELVMSCTEGAMGSYPIFIIPTSPLDLIDNLGLEARLESMAETLLEVVSSRRVYSVFAPWRISTAFERIWTDMTGIHSLPTPYYSAFMASSYKVFTRQMTERPDIVREVRMATMNDLNGLAELCYLFAQESDPFFMTQQQALDEAAHLIREKQVWVHCIRHASEPATMNKIACAVAYTRNTPTTATITKVITHPNYRRLGCAELLIGRVCKHLFTTKERIVLYAGVELEGARRLYTKVGFQGLSGEPLGGANHWVEIGFDRTQVTLGHW